MSRSRRAVLFLLFLFWSRLALAQTQARMSGSVTSPDAASVPGVTVRLEAADKQASTVSSDSNRKGRYLMGMIRPGDYLLRVETHSDLVPLRIKGRGLDQDHGRAVLWEIDQEVSAEHPPKVSVGPRNQIELDIVVGPRSMTAQARHESEVQATQEAFSRGYSLVQQREFASALEVLEPLAEKTPDHANTWYLIAFSRERLARWDTALAAADRVLTLDPALSGAHLLRGRILKGQGSTPEAEAEFRTEIETGTEPSVVIDAWVALATCHRDANRLAEAAGALEKAVAIDPTRRDVLLELARLQAEAGDREQAARTLERVENAGGMDGAALLNLAIGYVNDRDYGRAEQLAQRLIEKGSTAPDLSLAHSILARCDLGQGEIPSGIDHLQQALSLDPASPLAAENREILSSLRKN